MQCEVIVGFYSTSTNFPTTAIKTSSTGGAVVTVGQSNSTQLTTTASAAQANDGGGTYDSIVGVFRIH